MSKRPLFFASTFLFRSPVIWIALSVGGVLIVTGVSTRARNISTATLKASSSAVSSQPPPIVSPTPIETERITITSTGFNPEEITRPAGIVRLAVDNRSGLMEVHIRLDRENGERLIDVRVDRNQLDWRGRVDLSPGRYTLTEASHPDWVCVITITQ